LPLQKKQINSSLFLYVVNWAEAGKKKENKRLERKVREKHKKNPRKKIKKMRE